MSTTPTRPMTDSGSNVYHPKPVERGLNDTCKKVTMCTSYEDMPMWAWAAYGAPSLKQCTEWKKMLQCRDADGKKYTVPLEE